MKQVPEGQSLIPKEKSYKNHLTRYHEIIAKIGLSKYHGLRHAYAQRRYYDITKSYDKTGQGLVCPIQGQDGKGADKSGAGAFEIEYYQGVN
ncbi:hypothetical protein [Legionella spiritensis]|uniref:hypothetical protein n=1 Tax=Legionella spiritensis TaxID=452 RepID=UPI001E34E076|nr:hypothetical protein [Legionella spiritensis]